jgi:ribosomal protein S18 acetylase RimI-like enzyme
MKTSNLTLTRLRENSGTNLRAIEDLTKFSDRSQIFSVHDDDPKRFAYLLISGHPSTIGQSPTVIMGGNVESSIELTNHLPKGPYTILETRREFLNALEGKIPNNAPIYHERRMEVLRSDFKAVPSSRTRQLVESDDVSLAQFIGAPPQAAAGMRSWIKGAAALLGIFEGPELISMGSSFCNVPEGWSLVAIKTHKEYRKKGYGIEVTSALCSQAFKKVDAVELTVLSDNTPAIALYQKLGFELKEERVWIDCGSGSKPF